MSEVGALQQVLAGEHAAIYAYGVIGAHLAGESRRRATTAYDAHRAKRDQVSRLIVDRKAVPVAAAAAYELPRAVSTPADATVLATEVEERLAAVWVEAVGGLRGGLQAFAARAVQEAAVRAAVWRGGSVPFPGLPQPTGD
jgi:uncharacterized protein DUF4439